MFLSDLHSPLEFARRLHFKLQTRSASPSAPPTEPLPRFRVSAWRWHHLGVIRDLTRLERRVSRQRAALCAPSSRAVRVDMLHTLRYILHDNWQLHDLVESRLFIPWISTRVPAASMDRSVAAVSAERSRLADESLRLEKRVESWVDVSDDSCERELLSIVANIISLRRKASQLFQASEAFFIPRVRRNFSEKEQLKFNSKVLRNITGKQARISLVVFRDAVDSNEPRVASEQDFKDFESEIPSAIRRFALPHWRRKFVDHKIRFLTDKKK